MSKDKKEYSKAEQRKMNKMKVKQRNQRIMMISAVVFVVIIAAIYVVSLGNTNDEESLLNPVSESNVISDTQISIPLTSISSEATFYNYESNGVDIYYFAVKDDDEQVHVALDSCDVCYHAKEGYRQVGDLMECLNCGLTFPIEDIGEKNSDGGCWPSFIPITLNKDNVLIEKSDLESKRFMFE